MRIQTSIAIREDQNGYSGTWSIAIPKRELTCQLTFTATKQQDITLRKDDQVIAQFNLAALPDFQEYPNPERVALTCIAASFFELLKRSMNELTGTFEKDDAFVDNLATFCTRQNNLK